MFVIMSVTWQKLFLYYEGKLHCNNKLSSCSSNLFVVCDICLKVLVHVDQFLFVILVLNRDQSMHN